MDTNPKTKWYIGILQVGEPIYVDIFSSVTIPTNMSHGDVYKYAMGPYTTRKEATNHALYHHFKLTHQGNPGAKWHRDEQERWKKAELAAEPESATQVYYSGRYDAHRHSGDASERMRINPEKDFRKEVGDFVHKHGIAHGGNWSAMFMSAIRYGAPEIFKNMEDRSYDFRELYDIIANIVRNKKNPFRRRHIWKRGDRR